MTFSSFASRSSNFYLYKSEQSGLTEADSNMSPDTFRSVSVESGELILYTYFTGVFSPEACWLRVGFFFLGVTESN